ncbi:LysM peptidoglycan-binding domain-containing protein [Duncaniella muricolitica]|jgi:LysM repeat protein|uniref:LysM peptidoglycan-binding domain-containing protein n=1 Tax=Duncaniella muricolitica TaxID=2880704 RepID=UPI00244E19B1|nr:LysM peptidoglycan-binding domain-containing protein [Duncaniella muricolitica]
MNFSRFTIAAILMGAASVFALHAAVKDLPVKTVNGRLYHYYEVPAKETVYSLCYKLDISKDEMIRHNPSVADGLRAGMTLFFPVEESAETAVQPSAAPGRVVSHHVQKGETIFGIAHKYGVNTEAVIEQNPVLKNGLKAGQTIQITVPGTVVEPKVAESAPAQPAPVQPAGVKGYIVKKKETFYSIAVANGLSVAALEAANPGVTSLKEGQVLNIPVREVPAQTVADASAAPTGDKSVAEATADSVTVAAADKSVSLAVMLPFMLNEESPSKNACRYTEFYKGLLLAVDSLRNNGTPIHVTAYDTEGSVLKVREALTDSTFRRHNAIIAPDNSAQMAILAEYGKNNNVKVVNTFIVRDDSYLTNPDMVQANLPSQLMYRKAIDALMERFENATPVFLNIKGTTGDKTDFVGELRKSLDAKGKTYMEVEADGRLTVADLKPLPADGNYVFVPATGRQADLNKLMPGIIEWRDQAVTPTVQLFGYPEWTTFRGETLENMHNLNTTVYSRFYTDEESARTKDIDARYKQWYGARMENAVPRLGLLGFDTGMFVIPYMLNGGDKYDGVQNGYYLVRSGENGGAYNDALYFVTFRPGNVTDKTRI